MIGGGNPGNLGGIGEIMENKINSQKQYPTIKNVILLCLLLIGLMIVLALSFDIISHNIKVLYNWNIHDFPILYRFVIEFLLIICYGIVLIIGFKKTKRTFNDVFKFNKIVPFLWFSATVFIMGAVILFSELLYLLDLALPMPYLFQSRLDQQIAGQSFIILIISIAIIPALTQEMLFRGLILDGLNRNYTKRKAIIVSALVFGVVYIHSPWEIPAMFLLGLFFAWVCIKTNSILLPMYMHFFYGCMNVLAVRYRDIFDVIGFNANFIVPREFQPLWLNIIGLLLLVLGIFLTKKGLEKTKNSATNCLELNP